MKKLTVMIVDDERSARQELKRALAGYPELELTEEAANADDAEEMIRACRPDLLFLDIQMPERSGFELLEALDHVPEVIFVTAYDQYALQAFEFNAFDYLLKPFREERVAKMMERIRNRLDWGTERRLFVQDGRQCFFVKLADIVLMASMDNYARLYFKGQRAIIKSSLNQLEEKLGTAPFFRANRTQLVNISHIQHIDPLPGGKLRAGLSNGEMIEFSERQSVRFRQQHKI